MFQTQYNRNVYMKTPKEDSYDAQLDNWPFSKVVIIRINPRERERKGKWEETNGGSKVGVSLSTKLLVFLLVTKQVRVWIRTRAEGKDNRSFQNNRPGLRLVYIVNLVQPESHLTCKVGYLSRYFEAYHR